MDRICEDAVDSTGFAFRLRFAMRAIPSIGVCLPVLVIANAATAQSGNSPPGLPSSIEVRAPDENGIDMYSGSAKFSVPDVALAGLGHVVSNLNPTDHTTSPLSFNRATGLMDNYQAVAVYPQCSSSQCVLVFDVGTGASSDRFLLNTSNGSFQIGTGGSTLISDPASSDPNCAGASTVSCRDWLYIEKDGTTVSLTNPQQTGAPSAVSKIVHPDGLIERVAHASTMRTLGNAGCSSPSPCASPYQTGYPVLAVNRSDGIQLKYQYGANWDLQGVIAINNAYEYCEPSLTACSLAQSWPSSSYSWSSSSYGSDTILSINDSAGRSTRYSLDNFGRVRAIKPPTSTADVYTLTYCLRRTEYNYFQVSGNDPDHCFYYWNSYQSGTTVVYVEDRVTLVARDGQTWNYRFPVEGSTTYAYQMPSMLPLTSTRPDGQITVANQTTPPTYLVDFSAPGVYATFEQNLANKVLTARSWAKGGIAYSYNYDGRANVLSDGIVSAGYDASCQNYKTCNKPNWTKDAKGNQTDYVYDPQHGGTLSVTLPPDANGVRPQTRFAYVQRYAWFLNASGQMVRSSDPVWKLASQSVCQNGAAAAGSGCVTAGDEVVTSYDYGPDSGPNNLWLRGVVVTAGGVSRRTCYGHDRWGHQISASTPRAGLTSCP